MRPPLNETDLMARLNTVDEQSTLSALMEHTIDRFIGSHILRITLPPGITAALKSKARFISGNTLDINLSRSMEEGTVNHYAIGLSLYKRDFLKHRTILLGGGRVAFRNESHKSFSKS